jgi:hypothetical protein
MYFMTFHVRNLAHNGCVEIIQICLCIVSFGKLQERRGTKTGAYTGP